MIMRLFPLLMSIIWCSIFTLITYVIVRQKKYIGIISVNVMLFMLFLSLARLFLSLDFSFARVIPSRKVLMKIVKLLDYPLITMGFGSFQLKPVHIILLIWIAGSLYFCLRFMKREYSFRRLLSKEKQSDNPVLYETLEKISGGKAGNIKIVETSLVDSPLVFGMFRPTICFPEAPFTDKEIFYFMSHEWQHIIHRDVLIKYIVHILCIIYWWNPLVYLLKREIDVTLEVKSDTNATKSMEEEEKLDYMGALTHLARMIIPGMRKTAPASLAFVTDNCGKSLEKRCNYLLNYHSPGKKQKALNSIFIALMCLLFVSSYFFIIQSDGGIPDEALKGECFSIESGDEYFLVPNKDGTYSIYYNNEFTGTINDISDEPFSSMPIVQIKED